MSSETRPEVVDPDGLQHRHGCLPEVTTEPHRGWLLIRCSTCGAITCRRRGA